MEQILLLSVKPQSVVEEAAELLKELQDKLVDLVVVDVVMRVLVEMASAEQEQLVKEMLVVEPLLVMELILVVQEVVQVAPHIMKDLTESQRHIIQVVVIILLMVGQEYKFPGPHGQH